MIQELQKNSEQSSLTSYSLWVEISKKSYFIGLIIVKSAFPSVFCILISWYPSILVSWYPGILVSWYSGVLETLGSKSKIRQVFKFLEKKINLPRSKPNFTKRKRVSKLPRVQTVCNDLARLS